MKCIRTDFFKLWAGQSLSMFGGAIVRFALGIWIFERTSSLLDFSILIVLGALPSVILAPLVGAVAGKYDRRMIVIASDSIMIAISAFIAILLWRNALQVGHIYFLTIIVSVVGAFQGPAYQSLVVSIIGKEALLRANGIMSLSVNILQAVAPTIAGAILSSAGLFGIVAVDIATFVAGAIFIWKVFVGMPKTETERTDEMSHVGYLGIFFSSLDIFKKQPVFIALIAYGVFHAAILALVSTLCTPLLLTSQSAQSVGFILTAGAVGGMVGSLLLVLLGESKYPMRIALIADSVLGLCIALVGLTNSFTFYCALEFLCVLAAGVSSGYISTVWMRSIHSNKLSSILALLQGAFSAAACVSILLGGILAQYVFEPAFMENGLLNDSFGTLIGIGKGRGLGFMFVVCGIVCFLTAGIGLTLNAVRKFNGVINTETVDLQLTAR
ncbi:diaminobutyrate-2-oxoglutarate transaminase [Undibacterium pigrum]|uniref:Diaminobutyrate-2-oxoglutarate transaminase n=1 Tax=Undibacterium pigrum TaxID=401470 RepID=A0A318INC8_9BURK|nr:diaminobutyrate-2-oxoglutarate transaminase [Undibacterium pigrum]